MKSTQQEIFTGLDLGSTEIRVAVGRRCEEGIEIIGVGESPSGGVRRGRVVNRARAATAIRKAIDQAELMSGCRISNIVVGIADASMCYLNAHAEVPITQGIVLETDLLRVIKSAQKNKLPPDCEILHVIPQEYIIDKQFKTMQPLGMTGSTLEVTLGVITVASTSIKNIVNACTLSGLKKIQIVLQTLATSESFLSPDEREQGVIHIDIGGGLPKIAVFSKGVIRYVFLPGFARHANHLTIDIAVGLRISMLQAEQVKRLYGCCQQYMVDGNFEVEVIQDKGGGTKLFSRDILVQIIEPRMEEMFTLIEKWLKAPDHDGVRISSAVITGGASSLMGMDELAKSVLKMPVRIGTPGSIEGVVDTISRPSHSTAVNLALFEAGIDGVSQGIKRSGGSLFVQHATLAIKRILERIA